MSDLPKAMTVQTHEMIVTRLERELEEAREKYADVVELLNDKAARLVAAESDLAEARQERDAARVSARSQKTKAQHARRAQQAMGARIQTLEAALRGAEPNLRKGSPAHMLVVAALQPTTTNEEVTPAD